MEAPSVESMLAEIEAREAAEQAARVNEKLWALKAHVQALKDQGVSVSIALHGDPDLEKDSLEVGPADCRCKFYCDLNDVDGVAYKLQRVAEIQAEAKRLMIVSPPKEPKLKGGAKPIEEVA